MAEPTGSLVAATRTPGMLAVLSDTHATDDPQLTGHTATAVADAAVVVHAGDFTTGAVLDAFHDRAGRLHAVHGNRDDPAVAERLPARRTLEYGGVRFVVVHGHEHSEQALSLAARETGADAVVVGHSHRPTVRPLGEVTLLNPGSHADPRRYRPAHAELQREGDGVLSGRLLEPDGTVLETFELRSAGPPGTG
jgi:putative phosphoesterase